ncbi:uncharacterized protein VTP21DRAFT_6708 [Calcarisporiella thermophila]|uniref:uncharacterized protein n=1 Tax=Calcarisporiella thermophila TaxID=911321 RepID=UPI00374446FE
MKVDNLLTVAWSAGLLLFASTHTHASPVLEQRDLGFGNLTAGGNQYIAESNINNSNLSGDFAGAIIQGNTQWIREYEERKKANQQGQKLPMNELPGLIKRPLTMLPNRSQHRGQRKLPHQGQ